MCFLVILGLLMGWLSERDRELSDGAEAVLAVRPMPNTVAHRGSSAPSLSPLPGISEFYLRPELIPVKGDGLPAVAEAERVVRSGR